MPTSSCVPTRLRAALCVAALTCVAGGSLAPAGGVPGPGPVDGSLAAARRATIAPTVAAKVEVEVEVSSIATSRPAREPHVTTIAYGSDPVQQLDLHVPTGEGPHPVIVWYHGGGWVEGTRRDVPQAVLQLLADGWAVASVDYRLSPAARFPAAVQDAKHAVRFLKAHGGDLGVDPARVVAAGYSAGGHLAAMVGATGDAFEPDELDDAELLVDSRVSAVVAVAGPVDLDAFGTATPLGTVSVEQFLDCADPTDGRLQCDQVLLHVANPATWARQARDAGRPLAPAYFTYGALDPLVTPEENGGALFDAWQAASPHTVRLDVVAGHGHRLDVEGLDVQAMRAFLAAVHAGWSAV